MLQIQRKTKKNVNCLNFIDHFIDCSKRLLKGIQFYKRTFQSGCYIPAWVCPTVDHIRWSHCLGVCFPFPIWYRPPIICPIEILVHMHSPHVQIVIECMLHLHYGFVSRVSNNVSINQPTMGSLSVRVQTPKIKFNNMERILSYYEHEEFSIQIFHSFTNNI